MARSRSHSAQTVRVLRTLADDPTSWRHGYDLCVELGLKSGSLYPILIRLADRGLLEASWESGDSGRRPRHLYRLTADGVAEAAVCDRRTAPAKTGRAQLGPA
jgi:DNA-binding PadR family transcriptional regulator